MSDTAERTRNTIKERVRRWFTQLRAKHPDERFYAVAFGFHDDFAGPTLKAISLEARNDPDSWEETWNDTVWAYEEAFHDAWHAMPVPPDEEDSDGEGQALLRYRAECIRVTIDALRALAEEGFWGMGSSQVLVFLSMWDGFEYQWLVNESARRIQPSGLDPDYPLLHVAEALRPPIKFDDRLFRKFLRKNKGPLATAYYELLGERLD